MLSYREVQSFLKSQLPGFRKTRLTNVALLVAALLLRRSFCLSELVLSFPGMVDHQYKSKRLWRFLPSHALQLRMLLPALAPWFVPAPGPCCPWPWITPRQVSTRC